MLISGTGDAVEDEDRMKRMLCSVLDTAGKARLTSLAMPLLGCGVAGWLIPLVAKATVEQVLKESSVVASTLKVGLL